MKSHSEIADFRARRRNPAFAYPPPPEPEWMKPREESTVLRIVLVGLGIALSVGLMLAFWARVASDVRDDEFTRNAVNECKAMGQFPHVYRDGKDKVLGVRCNTSENAK